MSTFSLDDVFPFGKFKGKTMKEALDIPDGRNYVKWAIGKAILSLDDEAKHYAKTGKLIDKPKVDMETLDFWQRVIIQGPIKNCPF